MKRSIILLLTLSMLSINLPLTASATGDIDEAPTSESTSSEAVILGDDDLELSSDEDNFIDTDLDDMYTSEISDIENSLFSLRSTDTPSVKEKISWIGWNDKSYAMFSYAVGHSSEWGDYEIGGAFNPYSSGSFTVTLHDNTLTDEQMFVPATNFANGKTINKRVPASYGMIEKATGWGYAGVNIANGAGTNDLHKGGTFDASKYADNGSISFKINATEQNLDGVYLTLAYYKNLWGGEHWSNTYSSVHNATAFDDATVAILDAANSNWVKGSMDYRAARLVGVPLADYYDSEAGGAQIITVPFKEFADNPEFKKAAVKVGSSAEQLSPDDWTDNELNLALLKGAGIARVDSQNGIQFQATVSDMAIVAPKVPENFTAVESGDDVIITFDATTDTDVTYQIVKTVNGEKSYIDVTGTEYTDTNALADTDAEVSYAVAAVDTTYGAMALTDEIMFNEPDLGTEIPSDNEDTVIYDFGSRAFNWQHNRLFLTTKGGAGGVTDQSYATAGIGTGLTKFNFNPNSFREKDNYNPADAHPLNPYRGYMVGGYSIYEKKGGVNENERGLNLTQYSDTAYATFYMYIDPQVSLENLYFTIGSNNPDGRHPDSYNFVGVPVTDYITEADRGVGKYFSIPMSDFKLSNPHAFQSVWNDSWAGVDTPDTKMDIDFTRFSGMYLLRRVYDGNNGSSDTKLDTPAYTSGYIYTAGHYITDVKPVKNFRIDDVLEGKITLRWDHTTSDVEKYYIYRTVDGVERTLIGETTYNKFDDEDTFIVDSNYKYEIEAVDKYGAKAPIASDETVISPIDHPRNFKVETMHSATTDIAIKISWTRPKFGELAKYVLYRDGAKYAEFDAEEFDTEEIEFIDRNVANHSDYEYKLIAVDINNAESMATNPIKVTAASVGIPGELTMQKEEGENQAELSYTAPDFAEKYYIYMNGEQIDETTDTTYTVLNIPYDEAIVLGVRAVNAAGATSNEVQTDMFAIKNPKVTTEFTIFDDNFAEGYTKENTGGASMTVTPEMSILGSRSMCIDFSPRKNKPLAAMFSASAINLKEYRENGGSLGFWLYADENTDLSKIQVGVGSTTTVVTTSGVVLRALVNLSDYVTAEGKWQYVSIPLNDIPDNGTANVNATTQTTPMNYAALKNIVFLCDTSKDIEGPTIYIDQLTIDMGSQWEIAKIEDAAGTRVDNGTLASAATQQLKVYFSEDMLPSSLTTENVKLRYTEAEEEKYVNYYGTYSNKVMTINLLEPLKANTEYNLVIDGARTTDMRSSSNNTAITTNGDTPAEITYSVPDIAPVITTEKNGSSVTVTVSMPEGAKDAVNEYSYTLSFDSAKIKPNGKNAVKEVPNGAVADVRTNSITVSGNNNGGVLSGNLLQIEFASQTSGNTDVTFTGTAQIYNSAAQTETPVSFNAAKTVAVSTSGGASSGSVKVPTTDKTDKSTRDEALSNPIGEPPVSEFNNADTGKSFADINEVPWAKDAIKALSDKGYINGYDDGTFKPNNTITREEFAKMLIELLELSNEEYDAPVFKDFDSNAWYAKYVTIATHNGYINGISDDMFGTGMEITRQDMCAMLYRAIISERLDLPYAYDAVIFDDEIADYAAQAVSELQRYGIINGVGDNLFNANGKVTRAMAAKALYAVYSLM